MRSPGSCCSKQNVRTTGYDELVDEQRLNPRLEIELPAEYRVQLSDEPQSGTIANLSAGGAAVVTPLQLPPHALLQQFLFALPTANGAEETLEASAVVVHAQPYLNDERHIEYCSGLHFLGFENQAFEVLEKFVLDRIKLERQDAD